MTITPSGYFSVYPHDDSGKIFFKKCCDNSQLYSTRATAMQQPSFKLLSQFDSFPNEHNPFGVLDRSHRRNFHPAFDVLLI